MARRIFDTIWIGIALTFTFVAAMCAAFLMLDHLGYVLVAVAGAIPFSLGWMIAKELADRRKAKSTS